MSTKILIIVCPFLKAAQSTGIQTLLEAEKEAAKIVQKARTCKWKIERKKFNVDSMLMITLFLDRTQKLKDARSEAAKEIEELKSKQEDEFNNFKKEVSQDQRLAGFSFCSISYSHNHSPSFPSTSLQYEGSQSSSQSQVEKETQEKLKKINEAFDKNNAKVVEKLLERVTQTKAELHRNLQKA